MKKLLIGLTVALFLSVFLSGCNNNSIEEEPYNMEMIIPLDKMFYASRMNFVTRMISMGEEWIGRIRSDFLMPTSIHFDPSLTELVFVHSEAEAVGFPDNVIVAWPRIVGWPGMEDFNHSQQIVDAIHFVLDPVNERHIDIRDGRPRREVFTLEDFGLSYPLTVADLVDNWEKVNELMHALTSGERSFVGF